MVCKMKVAITMRPNGCVDKSFRQEIDFKLFRTEV